MRTLGLWPLLIVASFIGCGLSPGPDLPSASEDKTDDGFVPNTPTIPDRDDGDDIIVPPPAAGDDPCTAGDGGGGMAGGAQMGGACGESTDP